MNARWTLLFATVVCAVPLAESQAQYTPTSQFGAQQAPQYSAQVNSQFQPANTQPTLPPTNATTYGQQGTQYTQAGGQSYPQGSSFSQQGQTQQQPARSSVFSTQPTVNSGSQGWTGTTQQAATTNDPRYTASVTNDPRYAGPQLSPPENATLQQYSQQLNTAATQFNNTLRDAQQQAQQYTQQAQQLGQTAREWQQAAQQTAQQYGQQVQPYLSSLTNNPYAYVPPQPQADPAANQYIAGNAQTAESQFGRSVLVNNQSQPTSSFGQQTGNPQYTNNNQYSTQPYANNTQQQQYTGGTQYTSNQQQQPTNTFDNRGQLYPTDTNNQRLTSGQSAFTNTSQQGSSFNTQDPRLMQTPTTTDPRYTQTQDPRNTQDPRGGLTLEPPLGSTLPTGSNQVTTTGAAQPINSPYDNVQTPRADGQNNSSSFGNTGGNLSNNQLPNNQMNNGGANNYGNGSKQPEVPPLFNNMLPANNRMANGQPYNSTQFGSTINSAGQSLANGARNASDPDRDHLWNVLIGCLVVTFASIGANFYFGWNFTEYYFRYRRLLVEGDDDDRRDDDRRR